VYHPDFAADVVFREVDNNVIPLGYSLLVERGELHRMREQVAVVGYLEEFRAIAQADLEKARDAGVENTETILAPLNFEIRLVSKIHGHHVADKAAELEDIHEQLTVLV